MVPISDRLPELWYLRIDDKQYGPVSRSEMENFLRPPRICSILHVMCSIDKGKWHSISRSETTESVLSKLGIQDGLPLPTKAVLNKTSPSITSRLSARFWHWSEDILTFAARFRTEISLVLGIVVLNATIFYAMSDGSARDRQFCDRFEAIWMSAKSFSPESTHPDEWRAFADGAIAEINPILKELQRTASSRQPARQALLFAGRDGLLKLLQESTPKLPDSRVGTQIDIQLKQAQVSLNLR